MPAPKRLDLLLGRGGQGKTHLALHLLRSERRVILCNPNGEAAHRAGTRAVCTTPAELVRCCRPPTFRVCWEGWRNAALAPGEAFRWCCRVALAVGNVTVFWDEADRFLAPAVRPPEAMVLINSGRHYGVGIVAASRRAARVPRDLSANASRIIVFRTTEPADLQWLREAVGREAAAGLPTLPQWHCLDWHEAGGMSVRKSPFG